MRAHLLRYRFWTPWQTVVRWCPPIWPLEVANVLVLSERKRRLTTAESARFIAVLTALPITVDDQTSHRAFNEVLALARAHRLTAYDAAYLELASREGLPIATLDNGLRKAARRLGIIVFKSQGARGCR